PSLGNMNAEEHISLVAGSATRTAAGAVDRRNRDQAVRRRGWLVRRALLFADVAGLLTAFVVSQLVTGGRAAAGYPLQLEAAVFLLTVPVWVVMAKIYGLYDRDEERTDHTTIDDIVGVFHLVTVGTWLFFIVAHLTGVAALDLDRIIWFWLLAVCAIPL